MKTWAGSCALVLVLIGAACGADEGTGGGSGATETITTETATTVATALPGTGQTFEVLALDNTFRPDTLEVPLGAEVVFTNRGRTDHDVIPADQRASDDLVWGVGADGFAPGDEYRVVFDQPGTYAYYCSIHGTATAGMVGSVVVTG